jgi:hypothetical protein
MSDETSNGTSNGASRGKKSAALTVSTPGGLNWIVKRMNGELTRWRAGGPPDDQEEKTTLKTITILHQRRNTSGQLQLEEFDQIDVPLKTETSRLSADIVAILQSHADGLGGWQRYFLQGWFGRHEKWSKETTVRVMGRGAQEQTSELGEQGYVEEEGTPRGFMTQAFRRVDAVEIRGDGMMRFNIEKLEAQLDRADAENERLRVRIDKLEKSLDAQRDKIEAAESADHARKMEEKKRAEGEAYRAKFFGQLEPWVQIVLAGGLGKLSGVDPMMLLQLAHSQQKNGGEVVELMTSMLNDLGQEMTDIVKERLSKTTQEKLDGFIHKMNVSAQGTQIMDHLKKRAEQQQQAEPTTKAEG